LSLRFVESERRGERSRENREKREKTRKGRRMAKFMAGVEGYGEWVDIR